MRNNIITCVLVFLLPSLVYCVKPLTEEDIVKICKNTQKEAWSPLEKGEKADLPKLHLYHIFCLRTKSNGKKGPKASFIAEGFHAFTNGEIIQKGVQIEKVTKKDKLGKGVFGGWVTITDSKGSFSKPSDFFPATFSPQNVYDCISQVYLSEKKKNGAITSREYVGTCEISANVVSIRIVHENGKGGIIEDEIKTAYPSDGKDKEDKQEKEEKEEKKEEKEVKEEIREKKKKEKKKITKESSEDELPKKSSTKVQKKKKTKEVVDSENEQESTSTKKKQVKVSKQTKNSDSENEDEKPVKGKKPTKKKKETKEKKQTSSGKKAVKEEF